MNLDQAITEWREQMFAAGITRPEILDELESHLREEIQRAMNSGVAGAEAFQRAAGQFGDGKKLKQEFAKIPRPSFRLASFKEHERKFLYRGLAFVVPAFVAGLLFFYFVLLPAALAASGRYAHWLGLHQSIWDPVQYNKFCFQMMLAVALAFEIPVIILVSVKAGWLNCTRLSRARPYVIVANLILAALLTTPEVLTQISMAVPLQLLYETSVWTAGRWERQEQKGAAA
jgi:hypothetical protein